MSFARIALAVALGLAGVCARAAIDVTELSSTEAGTRLSAGTITARGVSGDAG